MSETLKKYLTEVLMVFVVTFLVASYGWAKLSEKEAVAAAAKKQQDEINATVAPAPRLVVTASPDIAPLANAVPGPQFSEPAEVEAVTETEDVAKKVAVETDRPREPRSDEDVLYVEVTGSCGPFHEGECVRVRSGPGTEYSVVSRVRNGMVLRVGDVIETEERVWYKIIFDEWLRYPERLTDDWYVAGEFVSEVYDVGPMNLSDIPEAEQGHDKKIIVDRGDQKLYAFEGDELVMEIAVSTGLQLSPTPRGTFTIFRKTPTRYMQGPLPYIAGSDYYDLPGVPWNLYFTEMGAVVHGAYWHDAFGSQYSHGCVNVDPNIAYDVYQWADLGTTVVVRD